MAEYINCSNDTSLFRASDTDSRGSTSVGLKFYLNPKYAVFEDLDISFSTNEDDRPKPISTYTITKLRRNNG